MMPQISPPVIVAHRTGSSPRLRRKPVPIWTKDSKTTKNEKSQNVGASPQLCAACSDPDSAAQVYSSRPARAMASQAAQMTTPRG